VLPAWPARVKLPPVYNNRAWRVPDDNRRQTTTTDAKEHHYSAPTLCVGGPEISGIKVGDC